MLHFLNPRFAPLKQHQNTAVLIIRDDKRFPLRVLVSYKVMDIRETQTAQTSSKNRHSKPLENVIKITAISIKAS